MLKPTVYIETTVISYLVLPPSRDVIRLSREIITREWWHRQCASFDRFVSEFVLHEAAGEEPGYAARRLSILGGIQLLPTHPEAGRLADELATALSLPQRARLDAAHVAMSAVHGIAFLLTWDCRHLANAIFADRIERTCRDAGFTAPRIVTPEMLTTEAP